MWFVVLTQIILYAQTKRGHASHNTNKYGDEDVWRSFSGGQTPLHSVCFKGHLEVVKLLLKHGADKERHMPFPAALRV
jgi:ankyrin repeat protein